MASNKELLKKYVRYPVTHEMVDHLAEQAFYVIPRADPSEALFNTGYPSPPTSPIRMDVTSPFINDTKQHLPSLKQFITTLCERSNVQTSTLMSTAVYLHRLKSRLPRVAKGMQCTCHRVFLAALILSAKYLNDSSPKNKHWARYTCGLFSLHEVNLMEKQLLYLLDWDLRITLDDLYTHVLPYFLHRQSFSGVHSGHRNSRSSNNQRRSSTPYDRTMQATHVAYPSPPKEAPYAFSTSLAARESHHRERYRQVYQKDGKAVPAQPVVSQHHGVPVKQRETNSSNFFSRLLRKQQHQPSSPIYARPYHPMQEAW